MGKSKGTKETQGINGDAATLQRQLAAAATITGAPDEPCPYPRHRGSDWRLTAEHPVVCGVCWPPAAGLNVAPVSATAGQEVAAHA